MDESELLRSSSSSRGHSQSSGPAEDSTGSVNSGNSGDGDDGDSGEGDGSVDYEVAEEDLEEGWGSSGSAADSDD